MSNVNNMVLELEKGFKLFNDTLFQSALPDTMIVIQTTGRKRYMGWCTNDKIWSPIQDSSNSAQTDTPIDCRYEITICSEYLNSDLDIIMGTLLHEMVHLYCRVNHIQQVTEYTIIKYLRQQQKNMD
jgi:hypothetical protein